MKKAIAAVLLTTILLTLFAPVSMASEAAAETSDPTTGIGESAYGLFGELGEMIRNGGSDLWSAFKEYIGEHTSSEIVDHLKTIFRETADLTDEQLLEELRTVTEQLSISLSDRQLSTLIRFFRKLEKLDTDRLRRQVEDWKNNAPDWDDVENALDRLEEVGQKAQEAAREVRGFLGRVKEFFRQVQEFFDGLF